MKIRGVIAVLLFVNVYSWVCAEEQTELRLAVFKADVTPPQGSPLCNGGVKPALKFLTPLTARGVVILGAGQPIVLCAVDWVGIGNETHDRMRQALARATGTGADRVSVHTLHQHDAPGSDFATERLLIDEGLGGVFSNIDFDGVVVDRVADAAKRSLASQQRVTHVATGIGIVEKVASNRRILGADGRVEIVRFSRSTNPKAIAAPEGVIDPRLRMISFWNQDEPVAVLTWYATHPQSYYGQGGVNWEFVGMAREQREQAVNTPHIHFNGAAGNIAAGKYNDGSTKNRAILAQRLARGMQAAWDARQKRPVTAAEVSWSVVPVALPVRRTLKESTLLTRLKDESLKPLDRVRAARDLVFVRRMKAGHKISLTCLKLGADSILHMPGELFIEYQLAAQNMRPNSFVAMAAYGDYGPGYIGTAIAYTQGGYETGRVSRVDPAVERVLLNGIQQLLEVGE